MRQVNPVVLGSSPRRPIASAGVAMAASDLVGKLVPGGDAVFVGAGSFRHPAKRRRRATAIRMLPGTVAAPEIGGRRR